LVDEQDKQLDKKTATSGVQYAYAPVSTHVDSSEKQIAPESIESSLEDLMAKMKTL